MLLKSSQNFSAYHNLVITMSSKMGFGIIKQLTKRIKEKNTFDRTLDKVKILSGGDGKCIAEFTVDQDHFNLNKTLHGGFSATLVDTISTYAIIQKEARIKPVDMHIKYMKAARAGDEVVVEANTIRAGRTFAFLDVTLKNKKTGDILVYGTITKLISV